MSRSVLPKSECLSKRMHSLLIKAPWRPRLLQAASEEAHPRIRRKSIHSIGLDWL